MTRDEAIANLNMISVAFVEPITKEQRELIDKTFDIAIKALKQEPCEDCISRKSMWRVVNKCEVNNSPTWVWREMLSQLPSVQPKIGHWNIVSDGYGENAYICECSECKDTVWVYKNVERKWNYCPNCGAKMESEEEE